MSVARRSFDLSGHGHGGAPVPAASRVGPFVATSGIRGVDVGSGVLSAELPDQVQHMFKNLRTVIEMSGARVDTVLKVTIWIATPAARALINAPWLEMFPHPTSRPARHILSCELPGGMLLQCDALAIAVDHME